MKLKIIHVAFLSAVFLWSFGSPHILRMTGCWLDHKGGCPVTWCSYWGASGERTVHFHEGESPSSCWQVRFFRP